MGILYWYRSFISKYYAREYEPNMNIGSKRCSCLVGRVFEALISRLMVGDRFPFCEYLKQALSGEGGRESGACGLLRAP